MSTRCGCLASNSRNIGCVVIRESVAITVPARGIYPRYRHSGESVTLPLVQQRPTTREQTSCPFGRCDPWGPRVTMQVCGRSLACLQTCMYLWSDYLDVATLAQGARFRLAHSSTVSTSHSEVFLYIATRNRILVRPMSGGCEGDCFLDRPDPNFRSATCRSLESSATLRPLVPCSKRVSICTCRSASPGCDRIPSSRRSNSTPCADSRALFRNSC